MNPTTNWRSFLEDAQRWESCTLAQRRLVLELKPGRSYPMESVGDAAAALVEAEILVAVSEGARIRAHEEFREAARQLRAMFRTRVFTDDSNHAVREYLIKHFTRDQLQDLVDCHDSSIYSYREPLVEACRLVTSAAHVRGFQSTKKPASWGAGHEVGARGTRGTRGARGHEQTPLFPDAKTPKDLQVLLRRLLEEDAPCALVELPHLVPKLSRPRLARALQAGLSDVLLFSGLDDALRPCVGLLPRVARRLNRRPPAALTRCEPAETIAPWAHGDLVQLLIRAAEDLRLTVGGELFARARRELEAGLAPLPSWAGETSEWTGGITPEARLNEAVALGSELGFCSEEGALGRDRRLAITQRGLAWLELDPRAALAALMEPYRPWGREDEEPRPSWELPDLEPMIAAAVRTLAVGTPVDARVFLDRQVELIAPMLLESLPRHARLTEEEADTECREYLELALVHTLAPLGAVLLGRTAEDLPTLELTPAGRYLLGDTDELQEPPDPAIAADAPARIGPDFEVVFLSPAPALEAAFVRFAERLGTGVGRLFRITRASILAAANAGATAAEVLQTLRRASATALPSNVEHEIESWFALHRRLPLEQAWVIRCPDPETADRLLGAGGRRLERVGETVLVLSDPKKLAELQRASKQAGLFLTKPAEDPEPRRKRSRRRRYY